MKAEIMDGISETIDVKIYTYPIIGFSYLSSGLDITLDLTDAVVF